MKRYPWRIVTVSLLVASFALAAISGQDAHNLRTIQQAEGTRSWSVEAERHYAEGSYARARELYERIDRSRLTQEERRWLDFRLADTLWRSVATDHAADTTVIDRARADLRALLEGREQEHDRDQVWAEAQESLADSWWLPMQFRDWGSAWAHYAAALDWWSGARDVEAARARYLAIVWKASTPPAGGPQPYGYHVPQVPLEILENAVSIAQSPADRARARYLLALRLRHSGDPRGVERAADAFRTAIAEGRGTEWYDDALYGFAEWLERSGRIVMTSPGEWRQRPDLATALELYRRLIAEFPPGTSRYRDDAAQRIREITQPQLGLSVSNVFLPGSVIRYHLSWRNVDQVDLELWRIDLDRDVRFDSSQSNRDWIQQINLTQATRVTQWQRSLEVEETHLPGSELVRLERQLPAGAYLLRATAGGRDVRELLLVTDLAVVTKTSPAEVLTFVADARSGAPVPGAKVRVWDHNQSTSHTTDASGVARAPLSTDQRRSQILVTAVAGDRQAFTQNWAFSAGTESASWHLYAVTDRPAYRPEETVQWKVTARTRSRGRYSTPAGERLPWEIIDPRGTKVAEGTFDLNEFGSAWSELPLDPTMPLGQYTVRFFEADRGDRRRTIGGAALFRLEEYKLPEFRVEVTPARENGKPRLFRLGDTVEAGILAEYYFGGPVANASVEVVVRQRPFHPRFPRDREFPWYFETPRGHGWYGPGQEVHREMISTDADGRATVRFDSPAGSGDLEYTIEARVTDASRREITGSAAVRVTSQPFYASLEPQHYLHRPGGRVAVDLRTIDPNDQPVSAEGEIRVTREHWREVWLDPTGRRVEGRDLESARARHRVFPPPQRPDQHGWTIISRGYEREEIDKATLRTDDEGKATFTFTPDRAGYYRIRWSGMPDEVSGSARPRDVVTAESTVWVADHSTTLLGYHTGGVEVIIDRDSFRSGTTAPVMIVTPTAGAHVLFTVEAEEILEHRVVQTSGNVRLIELPISSHHIPNVRLAATMVRDLRHWADTKEVIVPPVDEFLEIEITPDAVEYQPRDRGSFTVTARDADGNPVDAEVSVAVVDASVFYIQQDYAGDPRQFLYGSKRPYRVQTHSSFNEKAYIELTGEDVEAEDRRFEGGAEGGVVGGVVGGVIGGVVTDRSSAAMESAAQPVSPPAAPPPPPQAKLAEADEAAGAEDSVTVRSDFRSTAFWSPAVRTGAEGRARIELDWPDSLTTWRATARAFTTANRVGWSEGESRTAKPLIVRLQAPRFFVVGDETTISAVINNQTAKALTVSATLELSGLDLGGGTPTRAMTARAADPVTIPAGGESRLDWRVAAREAGSATIRITGRGGAHADAMERTITVYEHGIEKLVASSGALRSGEAVVTANLPERRDGSTTMTVQVTPSIAVTMLDALPYLIDFPYGCTEQTMSRFLPAAIVSKTLADLGIDRNAVATRVFGGIEQATIAETHPDGRRELAELDAITTRGLLRLYDFQKADGSWGWWKEGEGDRWMTAYLVWGLSLARDGGIEIRRGVLDRAVAWLDRELVKEETAWDRQAWMLHGVTAASDGTNDLRNRAFLNLWTHRDRLSSYGRALLALSSHELGRTEEARTLVRNLENGARLDEAPDRSVLVRGSGGRTAATLPTAHWGSRGFWWRWHESPVESTSFVLRALVTIEPQHHLVEPAMNWLVRNRRGAQWNNTRDTAIAVLALDEYLKRSGELGTDAGYEIRVNGTTIANEQISRGEILRAPSRFDVPTALIRDGNNEIVIRRISGEGVLYFATEARFFSLEEPVKAEGNEIFVRREYYRLVPRRTLLKGIVHDRVLMEDGASIRSGERVDVVVTVETKNDYEYLIFEDLKPAGFEAVAVRSGEPLFARQLKSGAVEQRFVSETEPAGRKQGADLRGLVPSPGETTGRTQRVHQELRDRQVTLFADRLSQGVWEIRYTLRAEVPGSFHALPLLGSAMYVPEIRANSDEVRVVVEERAE